jgi:hypothetical protein
MAEVQRYTKLSQADVRQIRERLADGARPKDLGREFKVHPGHISRIGRRQQWRKSDATKPPRREHEITSISDLHLAPDLYTISVMTAVRILGISECRLRRAIAAGKVGPEHSYCRAVPGFETPRFITAGFSAAVADGSIQRALGMPAD